MNNIDQVKRKLRFGPTTDQCKVIYDGQVIGLLRPLKSAGGRIPRTQFGLRLGNGTTWSFYADPDSILGQKVAAKIQNPALLSDMRIAIVKIIISQ